MPVVTIPWWPQPKQLTFVEACGMAGPFTGAQGPPVARVIGFGGAAGGGKTDALLGVATVGAIQWPGAQIAFFRRTYPELSGLGGAIDRSRALLGELARYHAGDHRWTFPNGSALQFCHCQREADVHKYQSQQFDILLIDEATHFTEFQVRYLMTRNRATVDGAIPFAAMATNPGGVGHLWYRDQFVDIGPPGVPAQVEIEPEIYESHIFIPARLDDNKILEQRDPGYRQTLMAQPEAIQRALLEGDWDVFIGQVFTEWRRHLHVIKPQEIPDSWIRWCAVDWGYAAPWCSLWFARDPDSGRVVIYREAYTAGLTDPEQAQRIKALTAEDEKMRVHLADPSMWTTRSLELQTKSSADVYREHGVILRRADNDRLIGKRRVHDALAMMGDGRPGLLVFETCRNLIRTLPALPYDEIRVEDVDDDAEDHAYDALRYGLSYKISRSRDPDPGGDYWEQARRNQQARKYEEDW